MVQKTFTFKRHLPSTSWLGGLPGYLSKLVALVVLVGGSGFWSFVSAQGFIGTELTISAATTATNSSTVYTGGSATSASDTTKLNYFNGSDLGNGNKFDPNNGTLTITASSDTLNGATAVPGKNGTFTIVTYPFVKSTLYYRVYLKGSTAPSYSSTDFTLTSSSNTSHPTTYALSSSIDLFAVAKANGGGTYQVDVYFEGQYRKTGANTNTFVNEPGKGSGNPSSATFQVNAPTVTPSGATTTWQGTVSSDWSVAGNWTNGVPNSTANAIVPAKSSTITRYPVLDDPNYNYAVKTITLQGTQNSTAAQLTINIATLSVFGNINQTGGGLTGNTTGTYGVTDPTQNSTIILAGADQIITGNLLVSDIIIAGSGTKSIINQLIPANILAIEPASASAGVIVQSASQDASSGTVTTQFDTTGNSYIQLGASALLSTVAGQAETNTSYVKGVLRADRTILSGVQNTFGNIGLDITANHNPGRVYLYRVVGDALTGPTTNSTAAPITRQYKIVGDDDSRSNSTAGSTIDVVFHYLNSANELNGINENNLTMFRTEQNGPPYRATGGDLNTANKTFVRIALPSLTLQTLTLGDKTNPLPVSLALFAAVRSGSNALISWTTATEENNKGFNVQVSADGLNFRTLAFVASQSPNSSTSLNYKYTDTENGKTGTRYYRLEQVDESGKTSYSPVRALNFDGTTTSAVALVAYPNPFTNTIDLSLNGTSVADGTAYVKLVDMTGRTVLDQKLSLVGASLSLGDLTALRSGLYLAKVTLPDGSTQTVRVQKQ